MAALALSPAGKHAYSRKSHFGVNSKDHLERHVLGSSAVDVFSVVDLEFRRVDLSGKLNAKARQTDEAQFEA